MDKTFVSELNKCRRDLAAVFVFSCGVNLLMLTLPIYMLQVFDRALTTQSGDTLILLTVIAVFAVLILSVLDNVRLNLLQRVSRRMDLGVAPRVAKITTRAGQLGATNAKTLEDVAVLRGVFDSTSVPALLDAPWVPVFLIVLFLLNPLLGIIGTVGGALLFVLAIFNEKATAKSTDQAERHYGRAHAYANDMTGESDTVLAMGIQSGLSQRWMAEQIQGVDARTRASYRNSLIASIGKFARFAIQIAILGSGAWLVVIGELTAGGMIAGSIILGRALAPIEQVIGQWKMMAKARTAYLRVNRVMAHFGEEVEQVSLPKPQGEIIAENLVYAPAGVKDPTIRGLSFKIDPGSAVALIGPTGAGKSTLLKLIVGAIKAQRGVVRLDGADVGAWDPADKGRHIGYVSQRGTLFGGTIAENIARMDDVDEEAVVKAAQFVGAHDMIVRLPDGYETKVSSVQSKLSGGQEKLVALARATYGDPSVIVIDEADAGLDAEAQSSLQQTITAWKQAGKTVVCATHRPTVANACDLAIVMKAGQITEIDRVDKVLTSHQSKGTAA